MARSERGSTLPCAARDLGGEGGPSPWVLLVFLAAMAAVGAVTADLPWTAGDVTGVVLLLSIALGLGLTAARASTHGDSPGGRGTGRRILLLAFALRGFAAIAQRLYPVRALYRIDADLYDQDGWAIAQAWLVGIEARLPPEAFNVEAYERLTAAVYLVVGRSVLTMQVLTALLGALTVYYAWLTARELIGEQRAWIIALLLAVWPSHILWTSQSLRDPWVFFLISRTVWSGVLWLRYRRTREWVKAVCFAGLVGVFRVPTGVLLGAVLLGMSAYVAWRAMTWRVRLPLLACALGAVLFASWVAADGDAASALAAWSPARLSRIPPDQPPRYHGEAALAIWSPEGLSRIRQGLARGGSVFYPELRYVSWLDVLGFAPIGLVHVLFAPFPWNVENAAQLGSALENAMLCVLVAIGLLMPRGFRVLGQRPGAFVGLVVLLGLGVLAVIEGNLGTAYRHKMQFLPYLLMLVGAGWPALGDTAGPGAEPSVRHPPARAAPEQLSVR